MSGQGRNVGSGRNGYGWEKQLSCERVAPESMHIRTALREAALRSFFQSTQEVEVL